jgi:hypothetical protein
MEEATKVNDPFVHHLPVRETTIGKDGSTNACTYEFCDYIVPFRLFSILSGNARRDHIIISKLTAAPFHDGNLISQAGISWLSEPILSSGPSGEVIEQKLENSNNRVGILRYWWWS